MRPQVEDVDDDVAAEEENKLINEVCVYTYHFAMKVLYAEAPG
jgi:hypothetical protein